MKKYFLKRLLLLPLGIIAYSITNYAQHNPGWTEKVYSQSVYPVLSSVVGFLPSLAAFSVIEFLLALFLLCCLGYIVYYMRKIIINKENRGMTVYRGAIGAVAIFCVVYFCFTALCGLNYYRYTFTYYTGYHVEQYRVEELAQLCASLAGDLSQAREALGETTDLFAPGPGDFDFYAQRSVSAMQNLAKQYPVLDRPFYSTPKPVILSELLSQLDIAGMFVPFTMESNINVKVPFFAIPSTMAHELAHQCGFMREDEANFISYLACKQSDDPMMKYSGLFAAFHHSIFALEQADPMLALKIQSSLSQAVLQDFEQYEHFLSEHEGSIAKISRTFMDIYLKANKQTDGVSSYNKMVELLLAEQRAAFSY